MILLLLKSLLKTLSSLHSSSHVGPVKQNEELEHDVQILPEHTMNVIVN